jgi:hypothetical protein
VLVDLNKLAANEKLAVYGSAAAIVGAILAQIGSFYGAGGLWLTLLLAIAMVAIVFLPQWSPNTTLPGSKGTLMLIVGGIAGVGAVLALLTLFGAVALFGSILWTLGLLLGVVGGLVMAWAGWQEFQAEGGKFVLGNPASGAAPAAPRADTAPPPAAPPPAATSAAASDLEDDRPASPPASGV